MSGTEKRVVFMRGSFSDSSAEPFDLFGQSIDAYKHLFLIGFEIDVLTTQLDVLFKDLLVLPREQVD